MAVTLATAVRSGILNFDLCRQRVSTLSRLWIDPEEPPPPTSKKDLIVSRYRMLGYHRQPDRSEVAILSIRQFGAAADAGLLTTNQELLYGVPAKYLKPVPALDAGSAPSASDLLETAAGNEPREGIDDVDLLARGA
jgi:hypothetical protein